MLGSRKAGAPTVAGERVSGHRVSGEIRASEWSYLGQTSVRPQPPGEGRSITVRVELQVRCVK